MKKMNRPGIHALAVAAALLGMTVSTRAAIVSNFDDGVYPGGISNGWASAWTTTFGTPIFRTNSPRPGLDGASPYMHLNATGGNNRNFRRQAQNALGVNFAIPHYIRWKFRLDDTNFVANFTANTDRVHFFGRNAAATASTDSSVSWMIFGAGAAGTGGINGNKNFWTCDAFDDSAAYNTTTAIDTGVLIVPTNVYSFEVYVIPELKGYYLFITNETTPSSFYNSASIQKFRNVTAPIDAFTWLHFGTAASGTTEVRPFDLDSVTITPWNGPAVEVTKPLPYAIHNPWEQVLISVSSLGSINGGDIGVTLNGTNANPNITPSGPGWALYFGGLATNADYEMIVTATNGFGTVAVTNKFYTYDTTTVLYDSEGFTNEVLYPDAYPNPFPLQAVTHGKSTWAPDANEPSMILSNDVDGRVLQRGNTGATETDVLHLPPISSGRIIFEFDAKVSVSGARTFDITLLPLATAQLSSHLGWGTISNKVAYYDGANWQPLSDLDTNWHGYKMVHYLSGPAAGYYDVFVDDVLVGEKLAWRTAIAPATAFSRFRLNSDASGPGFQYAWLDNLIVTAAPEDPNAVPPPAVTAVAPTNYAIVRPSSNLQFTATSILPIYTTNIGLSLNGLDVWSGLSFGGTTTNRTATYSALQAETNYTAVMTATNAGGSSDATVNFISTDQPWLYHPSDGWVAPWEFRVGIPELRTDNALGTLDYLHYDLVGFGARNMMRQYGSSGSVNVSLPHTVRWKFQLREADFSLNFINFNDRVHFFGRNAPRLTAGTDAACSWHISATGADQGGVSAGQKFYIFDNVDLTGAYNLANLVDSGIQVFPTNIYAFELTFFPASQTYSVKITNETTSAFFVSAAPHKYRDLSATATSHNLLHFGVQANTAANPRAIDLGRVTFSQAAVPPVSVTLTNPVHSGGNFSFSFQSQAGINHIAQYLSDITSSSWTSLVTNLGDGNLMTVTHTNAPAGPLYYRVESAQP